MIHCFVETVNKKYKNKYKNYVQMRIHLINIDMKSLKEEKLIYVMQWTCAFILFNFDNIYFEEWHG